jgi:predicted Fe-Mo cluster-binding NifX family protein
MSNMVPDIIVAIPCYGKRVLPRFDQAHDFLLAEIDQQSNLVINTTNMHCPLPAQQVVTWLVDQGVSGVICAGIPQQHQLQLHQKGLWLTWGVSGEIIPQLQLWLDQHNISSTDTLNHRLSDNCSSCSELPSI